MSDRLSAMQGSTTGQNLLLGHFVARFDEDDGPRPTAVAALRGRVWFQRGDGATTADRLYLCTLHADGTYAWDVLN